MQLTDPLTNQEPVFFPRFSGFPLGLFDWGGENFGFTPPYGGVKLGGRNQVVGG